MNYVEAGRASGGTIEEGAHSEMATVLLLQRAPERPVGHRQAEDRPGPGDETGRVLVCSAFLHAITRTGARIEMSGSHGHTF